MSRLILISVAAMLVLLRVANGIELETLIQAAGNAPTDAARLIALDKLVKQAKLSPVQQDEVQSLIDEIGRYLTDDDLSYFSREILDTDDYDFGVAEDSPLYPLTYLYRARMLIWATMEYGGYWSQPEVRRRRLDFVRGVFEQARRAFPDEPLARMYLGESIGPSTKYAPIEAAPQWAVAQREALERLTDIIHWWIDHRLQEDGQYGGGWGDDCEMWRWWTPVLIGFDDPKIRAAQKRFSAAMLGQKHMQRGYTTRIYDVEHTAEDSADTITPMLHIEPDHPEWKQRALRLAELMKTVWTGTNQRGYLQFKSTYFSVDRIDPSAQRACDTVFHPRALQPTLLLWQRTHDRALTELFTAWMNTWVDVAARAERGKPAGILPSAIHWPDGTVGGLGEHWWDPENHSSDPLYVFPSAMGQMLHTLLLTFYVTGDERYLAPIRSMSTIRLHYAQNPPKGKIEPGTASWCAAKLDKLPSVLAKYRLLTGQQEFDALLKSEVSPYVQFRFWREQEPLNGALEKTAAALRVNFPGYTQEVRYTDRVLRLPHLFAANGIRTEPVVGLHVPDTNLLYETVTGDPGNLEYFPLKAVRWLTNPRNLAVLVTDSGTDRLQAKLFHFGSAPRPMAAELYLLQPGRYSLTVAGEQQIFQVTGPRTRVEWALPPGHMCLLTVRSYEP